MSPPTRAPSASRASDNAMSRKCHTPRSRRNSAVAVAGASCASAAPFAPWMPMPAKSLTVMDTGSAARQRPPSRRVKPPRALNDTSALSAWASTRKSALRREPRSVALTRASSAPGA